MMVKMPKKGDDPAQLNAYDEANADQGESVEASEKEAADIDTATTQESEAEVRDEQSDAKTDSDNGVERD